jgi:AcrR family transcriptional regulator
MTTEKAVQRDAQATRGRLIAAARQIFSEHGYERTTVRQIAAVAGVNPALINRYFGGKEQLFAGALAGHFFRRWEGDEKDDLLRVLIRTAATNQEAAARIRTIFSGQVLAMVEAVAGPERARERAALIATQILGLAYARYVLGLSGEDVSRETIQVMVGETLGRYLFGALP